MTSDVSPAFGGLLRRYRLAAGLTQAALAERAHVSERAISALELGVNQAPRRATLDLLATALALSPAERATLAATARGRGMAMQGAETGRASAEGTSRVPLIGRGRELGLLDAHLRGEGPPVLLLAGEPGIGKTRLLEEAAQRAHAHGVRVLAGGCQRQGGQEPYAPVQGAIHRFIQQRSAAQRRGDLQGCAWLARLLPELAGVAGEVVPSPALPADQERRLMFAAVGRLLANVAGPAGTLLVLDDLQWAGPDALDLLGTLARAAPSVPLRLLGAYRDTDVAPQDPLSVLLADLAHADLVARQVVEPLTATEARRLCAVALEGLPASAVALEDRLIEKMGGVPFFVLSWAQGLRAGLPGTSVGTVPWRVAVGIHQRVAALPPPAQEALQVAAVMGRALRPALLAAITSLPEEMVLGALEGARRVRLLEETAEGYHFAHDVIREVVEEDVGLARRGLLHRKIAEYLAALPGEPQVEVLAMHFARSDTPSRAAPYLEQAGDRAFRQHAHVAAEAHYRALLALMGEPSERARAGDKLGRVLHTQGQYDAALAVLEPAAGAYRLAGDPDGLARSLAQIGAVHSARGTLVEGLAALQPQLAALEGGEPTRGLAALYGVLSDLLCMSARFGEAVAAAERGAATARVLRDERLLADAQAFRGQALSRLPGRRAEALAALEEAIRLGEATQAWATLPFALQDRARIAFHRGDFVACRQYVERAVQIAEQRGDPYQLASFLRSRGMMAFYRGDWDQARHDVERALAIGRAMGMHAISPFAPLFVAPLYLAKGDLAEAARLIEEGRLIAERTQLDDYALAVVQGLGAELDLLAGRPAAACARILPVLNAPAYTPKVEELQSLGPLLALAYLEQGEIAEATRVVERTLAQARADTALLDVIEALRVQALIALQVGWLAQAESSLEEALPLARSMPYPYGEARLLHADALRHRQHGDQRAARERLRAALVIFRQLGAHLDAELTEHLLAALG